MTRVAIALLIVFLLAAGGTLASPGAAYCAFAQPMPNVKLVTEARQRISNTFAEPVARPTIIYFETPDETWPFTFNNWGSTHFLPWKTCIVLGPKGTNIDVTAHELMHAEVVARVGLLRRSTSMPIWFDEGLAMQVDFRKSYLIQNADAAEIAMIKTKNSAAAFFVDDGEQLTRHYQLARFAVANWLTTRQPENLFSQLEADSQLTTDAQFSDAK